MDYYEEVAPGVHVKFTAISAKSDMDFTETFYDNNNNVIYKGKGTILPIRSGYDKDNRDDRDISNILNKNFMDIFNDKNKVKDVRGITTGYTGYIMDGCRSFQSKHAIITLTESEAFGKLLSIDGQLQSTEKDEYIYHEMLVHPIAHLIQPKRVKIYGGGEGATAREVLKWPSVEKVVQVDWDGELIDYFRGKDSWGASWSQGAYEDPRVEVRVADAFVDAESESDLYDYIIIDLPDQGTEPDDLKRFLDLIKGVKRQLTPQGGFVMNAGPILPVRLSKEGSFAEKIFTEMKKVNDDIYNYRWKTFVPSFAAAGEWCFIGGIKKAHTGTHTSEIPFTTNHFSSYSWVSEVITLWPLGYSEELRTFL